MKLKSIIPQTKIFLQDNMNMKVLDVKETNFTDSMQENDYSSIAAYLLYSGKSSDKSHIKFKDYNYMMDIDVTSVKIKTIISFEASLIEQIVKEFMGVSIIEYSKKEELYFDGASEFIRTIFGLAVPKYMKDGEKMKVHPPKKIATLQDMNMPEEYSMLEETLNTEYGSMTVCAIEIENNKDISKKTALVVDDSLMITTKMTSLLKELGHSAIIAKDGIEAIDVFKRKRPDFITMDVNMPNMNGVETLKSLIQIDPTVKVIMITSDAQDNIMMQAFKEGALDYILKPITIDKLQQSISTIYPNDIV